jgi:hypothetical protein
LQRGVAGLKPLRSVEGGTPAQQQEVPLQEIANSLRVALAANNF